MTKDVLIRIKGLHTPDGADGEEIEACYPGKYYFRNGKHYVEYEESDDEDGTVIKNRIALRGGRMELTRRGGLNTKMIFEENREHTGWYETRFFRTALRTDVAEMTVSESEERMEVSIRYQLEFPEQFSTDCRLWICIMSDIRKETEL